MPVNFERSNGGDHWLHITCITGNIPPYDNKQHITSPFLSTQVSAILNHAFCNTKAMSQPQCHNHNVTTTMSQPQCHNHNVTTTMSQPQCHNHNVTTTMSQPQCHNHNVTTTMSQPQCHNHNVTTTMSQPQCHNHNEFIKWFIKCWTSTWQHNLCEK